MGITVEQRGLSVWSLPCFFTVPALVSLQVLRLPPTDQRHMYSAGDSKFSVGVDVSMKDCIVL